MKTAKGKGAAKASKEALKPADDSEEFRKTFKKENPNVTSVAIEKAPYEATAAKKKDEYGKLMNAYNRKQESTADDGDAESDRSKSEVNDEDDEATGEGERFLDLVDVDC
ncbi:hypothetical protein GH714_017218 [Hevea brasiliensis]|uniref:HMG box domain-containing protein n=1 Tax=Hevea brasiliensis TaxID=3981 RepID=A0A6A6M248_HEVBR|nr:hypothetical protein GH714_017218 [Hevea brasiliensis]